MNRHWRESYQRKIRNWRIVAGILALVALYGFMGRMDAAHTEHAATQRQGYVQQACGESI